MISDRQEAVDLPDQPTAGSVRASRCRVAFGVGSAFYGLEVDHVGPDDPSLAVEVYEEVDGSGGHGVAQRYLESGL